MKITKLTCPNCGAPINKQTNKCEWCGSDLVISNDLPTSQKYTSGSNIKISIKEKTETNKYKNGNLQKGVAFTIAAILVLSVIFGIGFGISQSIENDFNTSHHKNEFVCSVCGSYDTIGFSTFWTNDGMICKAEELADYTIIRCEHCGNTWKHYL